MENIIWVIAFSFLVTVIIHINISKTLNSKKEVEYEKECLKAIFEMAHNIIFVMDKHRRIISMSKHASEFLGVCCQVKIEDIFLKYEKDKILNYLKDSDQYPNGLVCKVATKAGSFRTVLWQLSHIKHKQKVLLTGRDITENEKSKRTIKELEYYDQLTQLPNRKSFTEYLNKAIQQEKNKLAVLYIDLDNFKNVNDVFGHDFGDRYLFSIGQVIQECIEGIDGYAARIGGDEFAIVLRNTTKKNAAEVSLIIKKRLKDQILVEDILMDTTASIGVAFFPQDAKNQQELLICTDAAMYRAKLMGKNTVQFFNKEIYEELLEKNILINELKHALKNDKFILYYQPIYNTISNGISVVETLIRWDKDGEIIPPNRFIPISEETGLIIPIGYWVLKKAFEQSAEWRNKGINVIFSINISWVQLKQKNFSKRVKYLIEEIGVDPNMIIFEITEEIMFKMNQDILNTVKKIGQMGIKIALDDFGCEYSTLKLLRKIPINYLKLDKSNIKSVGSDHKDEKLLKELIALGNNLQLDIIAEGVEKEEQLLFLKDNGCSNIQGYMISKPKSPDQIEQMIQEYHFIQEKKVTSSEYYCS